MPCATTPSVWIDRELASVRAGLPGEIYRNAPA